MPWSTPSLMNCENQQLVCPTRATQEELTRSYPSSLPSVTMVSIRSVSDIYPRLTDARFRTFNCPTPQPPPGPAAHPSSARPARYRPRQLHAHAERGYDCQTGLKQHRRTQTMMKLEFSDALPTCFSQWSTCCCCSLTHERTFFPNGRTCFIGLCFTGVKTSWGL